MINRMTETSKEERRTKMSIVVFIWSALLFFINLYYNFLDEYDTIIFWLSILLMFATVIYQIFFLKHNTFFLFEIFIIYLFLHLIYQVGYYGLRGSDSYIDYNIMKIILKDKNFILGPGIIGWPILHIFSSILSTITNIDPLLVAKFLPSFISSIIVMPIYLLAYNIYKKKVVLFSCLIFGTIPQFMNFEAVFVREILALFFMILFFYIFYASKKRDDYRLILLSIILVPVITLSHHFTSLIAITVMGLYIVISKGIPYLYDKIPKTKMKFSGKINIKIIFLIVSILTVSYWFYLYQNDVIRSFIFDIINDTLGISNSGVYGETIKLGTPIVTLRGQIIFYGFFIYHLLFTAILFMKIILQRNQQKIEDVTFTIFLFFCLFYGFLAMFLLSSLRLYPDRILSFGWIFGIIPLGGLIINLKKDVYKKILIIILISFIVFNLYNIDSKYYTSNFISNGDVPTEKEYLIAEKISFPEIYYGYGAVVSAIYDVQGIEQRIGGRSFYEIVDFHNYSTLVVICEKPFLDELENLQNKSKEQYYKFIEILSYKNNKDMDKIYDLGTVYVLKGSE